MCANGILCVRIKAYGSQFVTVLLILLSTFSFRLFPFFSSYFDFSISLWSSNSLTCLHPSLYSASFFVFNLLIFQLSSAFWIFSFVSNLLFSSSSHLTSTFRFRLIFQLFNFVSILLNFQLVSNLLLSASWFSAIFNLRIYPSTLSSTFLIFNLSSTSACL